MTESIKTIIRDQSGTGPARAVRRQGLVPGVLYGGNKAPERIALTEKELLAEINSTHFFNRVFQLDINGQKQSAIAKDLQLHPVTDRPLHVDFFRVDKDSKIHVFVPVEFINEDKSPGIKRGGVLNIIAHTLELICPASAIPETLTVDLTGLELGHSLHLDVLTLDKRVSVAHPERDHTLATIVAPTVATETEATAEAVATETAETPAS
jgi:large subunit ribosomal protein L25